MRCLPRTLGTQDERTPLYCAVRLGDLTEDERAANIRLLMDAGASSFVGAGDDDATVPAQQAPAAPPQGGAGLFSEDEVDEDEDEDEDDIEDDIEDESLRLAIELANKDVPKGLQFASPGRRTGFAPVTRRLRERKKGKAS